MRRLMLTLIIVSGLLLAGCDTATPTPTATPTDDNGGPLPTLTAGAPTATPADYPPPPPPTPTPNSYGAPLPTPTIDPYPIGESVATAILIYRPLGNQCQDPATYAYPTLADAVADLEDDGVVVYDAEETARLVCEACDVCPTSEHFEAIIDPEGLAAATALGWLPQE